jgi:hypothetical protein
MLDDEPPEATVVAILHGWFVSWMVGAIGEGGSTKGKPPPP